LFSVKENEHVSGLIQLAIAAPLEQVLCVRASSSSTPMTTNKNDKDNKKAR